MARRRIVASILLVLAGVLFLAFFGMLLGIADCTARCVERGERAPVFVFLGFGLFLLTLGGTLSLGTMRAVGSALLAGGLLALGGALWVYAQGGRGAMVWVAIVVGAGAAAVGAWLRLWTPRDR